MTIKHGSPAFLPSRAQNVAESLIYENEEKAFSPRLEDIVSATHRLVRLAKVIDWDRELDHHFATVGAAALPTRLMTGLMYLQHMNKLPYHPTNLIKWRQRLGRCCAKRHYCRRRS